MPIRRVFGLTSLLLLSTAGLIAQPVVAWKRIAGATIYENLAGPATGPVRSVWYAAGGSRLYAVTASNRIFETTDFQHWRLNTTDSVAAAPQSVATGRLPETGAAVQTAGGRLYATGTNNVYASDDNGRSWLNLTGYNNRSIVGGGFTALAVSPANSQELAAANAFGVWRSLDGGLSWHSLNADLPNLPVRKLLTRRAAALRDGSAIEFDSGVWTPSSIPDPETVLRKQIADRSGLALTSAAQSGSLTYGGTGDGRVLASRDNGVTWQDSQKLSSEPIARIWQDPERPESALAASGNQLFRTVNGGVFWDDVTGALPPAEVHGITADHSAGIVYVATDRGVFQRAIPLSDAGPASGAWILFSQNLPAAPAWDVRLNNDNTLTVALDGYGVFEAPAPHQPRNVRIVNGADQSERAAAPGSLISVLGANIRQGRQGATSFPVIAASDVSSQLQVPFETAAGQYRISLRGVTDSWSVPLSVKEASPSIFVDGDGSPLILDSASGLVVDSRTGLHAGASIQVMATGLGKVTPDWPTGVAAPYDAPPVVRGEVAAFLDGSPVQVTRATLAPGYVGYYLVELRLPSIVNQGAAELRIVMNGEESNRVKVYLEATPAIQ